MSRPAFRTDEKSVRHRTTQRIRRNERKKYFVDKMGDKCQDCGESFPLCCYDFHHLDERTKLFEIAPGLDRKIETLEDEVAKCILLCSNCHRVRHSF